MSQRKPYLIRFAQYHEDFLIQELMALSKLENIPINIEDGAYDKKCPFLIINLKSDDEARRLIRRSILIKDIHHLWTEGDSYDTLHKNVKQTTELWPEFSTCSFKFQVISYGRSRNLESQIEIFNQFKYMTFTGPILLKNPDEIFSILEDFGVDNNQTLPLPIDSVDPKHLYFGRFVAESSRDVVNKFDLKKRKYLGTTSMDAELSLVMANMALVRPGSLVYDPFVGTGSFLVTCGHFGGFCMGSDIDGRQIRGKGNKSIQSNIEQYDLANQVLDTVVIDIAHHPFKPNVRFDAIVTDPPYGVRAGAKKLGRKSGNRALEEIKLIDGVPAHLGPDYLPPKVNYEMPEVLSDLLNFAAQYLVLGGRIAFWLPNAVEDGEEPEVPSHPNLLLIADSEQVFNCWSRRLITMEKINEPEINIKVQPTQADTIQKFRERYWQPKLEG